MSPTYVGALCFGLLHILAYRHQLTLVHHSAHVDSLI